MNERVCTKCKIPKSKNEFYAHTGRKNPHTYCKSCFNEQVLERQRNLKKQAIDYKGGSCTQCGYKKCPGALQFHHVDPSQKDFTIGNRSNANLSDVLKSELDKCILLCANCHAEKHYKG